MPFDVVRKESTWVVGGIAAVLVSERVVLNGISGVSAPLGMNAR